ncbi:MAG: hypothetical protein KKA19_04425, partial [Candidatus Margulisbacteria bacterium]|nr:hypothetical protein [Candidatus Margulisiibacteriota bacterium]
EELKVIKTKKEVIGQRLGQLAELNKQFASKEKELELVQEKLEKNKDKHLNIEKEYKNIEKEYVAEKKKAEKYQIRERNLKNLELEIEREQKHLEAMNKAQQEIVFKAAEFNKTEKEYKEIKKSIESIRKKIETVKMSSGELQAKRDIYRQQYQELVKKEENILNLGPKAKCPTCQRPLANDLQAIEKHFNSEKTTLSKQGQELNVQIKAIEKEEAVLLTELKENGKEETTLLKSYQNMLAAKSKKEQLEKQKEKITKEIEKLKPEVLESKNALEEIEFDSAKYKNLEKSYNKISGEYQQAKESWQQSSFQEQLIKKEVDLLKAQLIKVKEDEKALKELTGEHENLQSLLEVFANFRVYLISKIRPTLGLIAGRLFAQMTQGKYSGLELDEDYEIYIEDQGKKYSLSRFSGGEMDLANLCLRLAISQYVTEQYGAEMYFVVLDEIFGSQDVLRKNAILEALVELNKRFRQIILITHVEEIKDVVGQVVRVYENEDGISYVQV